MTLEGAINFHETNDYVIYTMNSVQAGQYCVVLPKNLNGILNMLVDLHQKSLFDMLANTTRTKEQVVEEIEKEYLAIKGKYSNGILIFPMLDEDSLKNAVLNLDKQKMFDETKKIGAITSELYKKLTDTGILKQNIDQKIIIVEKDQNDIQFVEWLKGQMPNFVDGVNYDEVMPKTEEVNPFINSNPFVQENVGVNPSNVTSSTSSNSIFDTPSSINTNVSSEVRSTTPNVVNNSDIFGSSINSEVVSFGDNSVIAETGSPISDSLKAVSNSETISPSINIGSESNVSLEPKPVQNVNLEGTTAFRPVSENVVSESSSEVNTEERSGSKGFANLLILLVVLVGVTIVSIELGKFLYNVYGA